MAVPRDEASNDEALYARVQELEGRVEQLSALVGRLADDRERYAWPHERGIGLPRFQAALDTVYQATTFGYVAVYFVTGRTARVRLLVGPESPPTTSVGYVSSYGYVGGVVRPGEFWMAATHKPGLRTGYECVFTPMS
ncbi:hypothetical protein AB0K14_08135 [Actinosynnema sp. NPDC050801]|uniref:hypothetical protein n=1 Tax=unclassified Actinosynnema TaxID=2637065 RepID=UPI0033D92DA3